MPSTTRFGYRVVGEAKAKTLVLHPAEADAIRTVVAMYLGGKSLRYLCAYLDGAGLPPQDSKRWTPKSLAQLLRNPTLAGRRVDATGRTVLKVPAILDQETWRKLQAELDRKAHRKGVFPGDTAMLTGVVVCHKCGGLMFRINCGRRRVDGTKLTYWYYRCMGSATAPSTCKNMYPLEELEERTERYMTVTLARWPRYETLVTPGHGYEEEIYEVERDVRELDFDDPEYATKHASLLAERARLRALPSVPAKTERRKTGDTVGQYWATLETQADKRAFLLKLGMVIRVQRGRKSQDPSEDDLPNIVAFEGFTNPDHLDEFISEDVRRALDLSLDDPEDEDEFSREDTRSSQEHD